MSYNQSCVHGFSLAVDALKSVVLATAVVDKRLSVDEAVAMARMELEFQVGMVLYYAKLVSGTF